MDLQVALTSISTAISIAKTVSDINKDFDVSFYKLQMAELRSALADAKIALSDVQVELQAKDREIERLTSVAIEVEKLEYRYSFPHLPDDDTDVRPFCPKCIEAKSGMFRLHRVPGSPRGQCYCPHCKNSFHVSHV